MFSYLTILIIFSFFYMLGITLLYFSKSRIDNGENAIYKMLVLTNIVGLVLQFLCDYVSYNENALTSFWSILVLRSYLVYFILWFTIILLYVIEISFKKKRKITIFFLGLCVLASIFSSVLPMNLYQDIAGKLFYSYGPAIDATFAFSALIGFVMFVIILIKRKSLSLKKVLPLIIFLLFGLIAAIIQRVHPEIVIMTCVESFICGIMYFTIENPDLKVIDELETNRRIVDQNNEAKSNLLFKLSQELRHPLKEIVDLSEEMAASNNETMRRLAGVININADKMYKYVNNVLDITTLDSKGIKSYESKYNIRSLMDEVVMLCRNSIKSGIDFQYDISLSVPEYLYGDKIKIKQIVYSLILNVARYTDSGFISLSLEAINKYDMSRLIFVVEDSGKTLSIDEVNRILVDDSNETIDFDKLEKNQIDLHIVNRLIKSYEGNMIIKALSNKGNSYTITFDQKNDENKLLTYRNREFKRVLIVSNKDYLLDKMAKGLKKHFVVVSKSMYEDDVYDKLNNNEVIDYLIIDSELKDTDVVEFQKKVRELSKNNIKIYIVLPYFQEKIKDKYKKAGFNDYILYSDLNNEIDRIAKDK